MMDETLIDLLRVGDRAALLHLDAQYGTRLRRAAGWICPCPEERADLIQDVYLSVIKSIHRFKGDCQLFTWLYAILFHVHRRNNRQKWRILPLLTMKDREIEEKGADETYDRQRLVGEVGRILDSLPKRHKEVLILRYYESMKVSEISRILGVSEGTVKSRLHFAIRKMQKKMGPLWIQEVTR